MSWNDVKHNPFKSSMHYLLRLDLFKKRGKVEDAWPSSDATEVKHKALMPIESEAEEE